MAAQRERHAQSVDNAVRCGAATTQRACTIQVQ
jgi:hypothetical protein